ncbi:MAG: ABC transporter permease [Planctomycetes bacterium]|nr:ABC transporter permease [Planctomycetota bacterium]
MFDEVGRFSIFSARVFAWIFRRFTRWRLLAPQLYEVGVRSLPVISLTGVFVGMVLAVQIYYQLRDLGGGSFAGLLINISVIKELGPVLAGVMLSGRIGGALAAELGTMKVTEQVDALVTLAADPIRYLVVPRFLACLLLIPFLTVYCDFLGVIGGYIMVVKVYGGADHDYWYYSALGIENWDILVGVIKSLFFGGAIALISCYKGFHSRPGAEGVGRATTEAFVLSFIVILAIDLLMAIFFKAFYSLVWGTPPAVL